jgi:G3E family GTPase
MTRTPCTVIGGYLGAGKTTMLNHLLRTAGDLRLAVVVNDFGELGIDAELISSKDGDVISLVNGCVCCSLSDSLATTLAELQRRRDAIDHLVIEASGVSDPTRIADTAAAFGFVRRGVVVLADAEQVRRLADDRFVGGAVLQQLRAADVLVVTKTDLVDDAVGDDVRAWLREIASDVPIVDAIDGRVTSAVVLGEIALDDREPRGKPDVEAQVAYRSVTVRFGVVDRSTLVEQLGAMAPSVLRAKGFVALSDDPLVRHLLQMVGRRWTLEPCGQWHDEPATAITVIAVDSAEDTLADVASLVGAS